MKPIICLLLAAVCLAKEGEVPQIVLDQIETIRPNLEKALAEYGKKVRAENDKLCKSIEASLIKETKAGNLDNAMTLKAALEQARAGAYIADVLNPDVGDLLSGDPSERSASLMGVDVASWSFTGLRVIQPYRIEAGNLRFHSGGGIEYDLPRTGRYSIIVNSGSLDNWNPLDVGRIYIDDVEIYNQTWSARRDFDSKPIKSLSIAVNATEGTCAIRINEKVFKERVPFGVSGKPSRLMIVDRGSSGFGSNIRSIDIK